MCLVSVTVADMPVLRAFNTCYICTLYIFPSLESISIIWIVFKNFFIIYVRIGLASALGASGALHGLSTLYSLPLLMASEIGCQYGFLRVNSLVWLKFDCKCVGFRSFWLNSIMCFENYNSLSNLVSQFKFVSFPHRTKF